jgi:hypothetical protein
MLENQEWRESLECGTESDVLSAIRYLDIRTSNLKEPCKIRENLRKMVELNYGRLHRMPLLVRASRGSKEAPAQQTSAQREETRDRRSSNAPGQCVCVQVSRPS